MHDYVCEFPELNHLIGGYFHQDWDLHGKTSEDVARLFCSQESAASRYGAMKDIDRMIARLKSETELVEALRQFGCAYFLPEEEGAIRAWLLQLRGVLANHPPSLTEGRRSTH